MTLDDFWDTYPNLYGFLNWLLFAETNWAAKEGVQGNEEFVRLVFDHSNSNEELAKILEELIRNSPNAYEYAVQVIANIIRSFALVL